MSGSTIDVQPLLASAAEPANKSEAHPTKAAMQTLFSRSIVLTSFFYDLLLLMTPKILPVLPALTTLAIAIPLGVSFAAISAWATYRFYKAPEERRHVTNPVHRVWNSTMVTLYALVEGVDFAYKCYSVLQNQFGMIAAAILGGLAGKFKHTTVFNIQGREILARDGINMDVSWLGKGGNLLNRIPIFIDFNKLAVKLLPNFDAAIFTMLTFTMWSTIGSPSLAAGALALVVGGRSQFLMKENHNVLILKNALAGKTKSCTVKSRYLRWFMPEVFIAKILDLVVNKIAGNVSNGVSKAIGIIIPPAIQQHFVNIKGLASGGYTAANELWNKIIPKFYAAVKEIPVKEVLTDTLLPVWAKGIIFAGLTTLGAVAGWAQYRSMYRRNLKGAKADIELGLARDYSATTVLQAAPAEIREKTSAEQINWLLTSPSSRAIELRAAGLQLSTRSDWEKFKQSTRSDWEKFKQDASEGIKRSCGCVSQLFAQGQSGARQAVRESTTTSPGLPPPGAELSSSQTFSSAA